MWVLRLSLWAVAIFFAAAPVFLVVARTPAQVSMLLEPIAYIGLGRDLIFLAIAILAIGLVDAFDAISAAVSSKNGNAKLPVILASLITLGIIVQLVIYSAWSSLGGQQLTAGESSVIPYLVASLVSALVARLVLVFGTGG